MNAPQQQALPSGNGGATNGNGNGASTAVAKRPANSKVANLKDYLDKVKGSVAAALPKHMTPDRVFGIVVAAASRTPELLECTLPSIAQAVMQCAELGLQPGAMLGEAYLIPRNNRKNGTKECLMIPGYRGLVKLARQSGQVTDVYAEVVYANEVFEVELGLSRSLKHAPDFKNRPLVKGPKDAEKHLPFVYAVAKLKDGDPAFVVMTLDEVEAIRTRERDTGGPWSTDYPEMMKKTAIRRLTKLLPKSPDLERAIGLEEGHAQSAGMRATSEELGFTVIDVEAETIDEATGEVVETKPTSATDALKAQMKAQMKAQG